MRNNYVEFLKLHSIALKRNDLRLSALCLIVMILRKFLSTRKDKMRVRLDLFWTKIAIKMISKMRLLFTAGILT